MIIEGTTYEVMKEVFRHDLTQDLLHTDYQHVLCVCAPGVVAAPPVQAGLPDGGVCFSCGGMTVRTGTCTTCTECGETGGCG